MDYQKIINIAVIAHVDAGKSTLVDAFLKQSHVFKDNEKVVDCIMDSNDLERERGITIYSKNCSVTYKDYKINIVDTPGHADFSSEVERIIKTVDTVILLVDSAEGPMPQTRFVLQKSLEAGLRPILLINKMDKQDARANEVIDEVYELFLELNATDDQLDFPILFGKAREGIVHYEQDGTNEDIVPLFETIIHHTQAYPNLIDEPVQMQISALAYDDYIGRLGIGRVYKGTLKAATSYTVCNADGSAHQGKTNQIFIYKGLSRIPVEEIQCGEICMISGIPDINIGDTICPQGAPDPMPMLKIEEPTLSMNFMVNDSPFAGQVGKFVTSRNIRERLDKELEVSMDEVLDIVVLGRAARNSANIKNRQPIGNMYVKAENVLSPFYVEIIEDELNVKNVEFKDDVEEFVSYSFKPQLKTVGPKYGKLLGKIKEALSSLDGHAAMKSLNETGSLNFDFNGEKAVLGGEDLLIDTVKNDNFVTEADNKVTVVLDIRLDDALLEEGFVRELISKIQTMRKEAGFEVVDHITLSQNGNDRIAEIIKKNEAVIKNDTLADEIIYNNVEGYTKDWNLNGEHTSLGVSKKG